MRYLRPRNWTIRLRLTVLYGGLFLLASAILLTLTYLVVLSSTDRHRGDRDDSDPEPVSRQRGEYEQAMLRALLTGGAISLGVVGAAALGSGWLVAGRVLRPVHAITATARRIAADTTADQRLHERIALTGPRDEITELAGTFNAMLERLDRAFDGQRRFVANAAHELRTPLVLNRTLVETAVSCPDAPEQTRRLGADLLQVNERHQRLIDGMLALARADHEVTQRTPVDLADLADYAVDVNLARASAAHVTLSCDPAPALYAGEPVLLEHMVTNLVHNGVRHNRPGGRVRVSTGRDEDGMVWLAVSNTGPVVPGHEVERIFEPFRRLGTDRTDTSGGTGLGLAIARAVARAHGGTITAKPRHGGGLDVTVRFGDPPLSGRSR